MEKFNGLNSFWTWLVLINQKLISFDPQKVRMCSVKCKELLSISLLIREQLLSLWGLYMILVQEGNKRCCAIE